MIRRIEFLSQNEIIQMRKANVLKNLLQPGRRQEHKSDRMIWWYVNDLFGKKNKKTMRQINGWIHVDASLLTSDTKNGSVVKFARDGFLDNVICFVIDGCWVGTRKWVVILEDSVYRKPVASSMTITLLFFTNARARETRERYNTKELTASAN